KALGDRHAHEDDAEVAARTDRLRIRDLEADIHRARVEPLAPVEVHVALRLLLEHETARGFPHAKLRFYFTLRHRMRLLVQERAVHRIEAVVEEVAVRRAPLGVAEEALGL